LRGARRAGRRRIVLTVLATLLVALLAASPAVAKPWIGVEGGDLVDGAGHTVRLLGVNR
jgi:hypothetical protein